MSFAVRRERKKSPRDLKRDSLSKGIRKVINESECTYGEIISVLEGLAYWYNQDAKDVIIGATLVSPDEKKGVRTLVCNDTPAQGS